MMDETISIETSEAEVESDIVIDENPLVSVNETDIHESPDDTVTTEDQPDEATDDEKENEESTEQDSESESIDYLHEQICTLKQRITELEAERDNKERLLSEIGEFSSLFPHVDLDLIPEQVWESVKKGTSLPASYALYEKRILAEEARIRSINESNASRSAGIAGINTANEYFSPDEVRKMSPSEVHANYSKIKESMKKWM